MHRVTISNTKLVTPPSTPLGSTEISLHGSTPISPPPPPLSKYIDIEDIKGPIDPTDPSDPRPRMLSLDRGGMLSVTDLSAQIWCEQQIILKKTFGRAPETMAMIQGTARHEVLELKDHDIREVTVSSREEMLAFRLLNAITLIGKLISTGTTRELWVIGYLLDEAGGPPIGIRGVIDELDLSDNSSLPLVPLWWTLPGRYQNHWSSRGSTLKLGDTKTRRVEEEPSNSQKLTSAIQLQTYHYLVSSLRAGEMNPETIFSLYRADPSVVLTHSELGEWHTRPLWELMEAFLAAFRCLPPLLDYAAVVYDCNGKVFATNKVPCSSAMLRPQLTYLLAFWDNHKREPDVPAGFERWKCKWCHYLPACHKSELAGKEKEEALKNRLEKLEANRTEIERFRAGGTPLEDSENKEPPEITPELINEFFKNIPDGPLAVTPVRPVHRPRQKFGRRKPVSSNGPYSNG